VLEKAGVAPTARGEQLTIDDFVRIAEALDANLES
jgi:16S rRNA (adenine1518-N6/adenine1519-N6)-dimethyltransferase